LNWCGRVTVDEKDISWREIGIIGIVGILLFIIAVFFTLHGNQYTPEESIYNVSIDSTSDGIWNVNITGSILKDNNYFGVMILWIDSYNSVMVKELAYNQSHVVKSEVFNISRTYNLSETPSRVLILYYDNPYILNDESGAHLTTEYMNRNGTWTSSLKVLQQDQ
jgi:hypothetical protein